MKKNKLKVTLLVLITALLCLSVGVYAGYTLTATEVSYTKPDGTTVSVKQALDELHEKNTGITVKATTATTHTATTVPFGWLGLSMIAQKISDNSSIGKDTAEVEVQTSFGTQTLGVGDTTTVDGKTVRILGFNHDTLTSETAYGTKTATGKAGISFEYVDFINVDGNGTTTAGMNSSNTNTNGWGGSALRSTLNSTTKNSLSIKDKIKQVNKEFIKTYNQADSIDKDNPSTDYLWLLSCGEIWNNGYGNENTRGFAIATEGSQYKYYKSTLKSTTYNSSTNITKKPNTSSRSSWWLRSPHYNRGGYFCLVSSTGSCVDSAIGSSCGVAPGFSI